jgi:ABC-2 type transport system ATP-binding protein
MPEIRVRVVQGPDAGEVFALRGPMVVGRDPDADLLLTDEQVSRRHVRLTLRDGAPFVVDLASSNGTFVNDILVVDEHELEHGDRIRLGETLLEVLGDAELVRRARRPGEGSRRDTIVSAIPTAKENDIVVEGLVREFPGGMRAVDELYLQVNPGEIYGFLGPNGAGKSTTVHMLTTLLPPSGGTAHVAGYDIVTQSAEVRASIGVALQEASLDPLLNAHEHMRLQCALQRVPRAERDRRTAELMERVRLTEFADRRVGGYSGGQKRRLDLAMALVHSPRLIFLDEPTTGLDPKSRADLWEEVARLAKEEGSTVFLTTQYLEEADVLADRVGIIDHGHLVAEGTPAELKAEIGRPTAEVVPENPADRERAAGILARFGEPAVSTQGAAVRLHGGPEMLADIVRAFDSDGLKMANLALYAPTLDDVFLTKTGRSLEDQVRRDSQILEIPPVPAPAAGEPVSA